jgi:hypothetical protein
LNTFRFDWTSVTTLCLEKVGVDVHSKSRSRNNASPFHQLLAHTAHNISGPTTRLYHPPFPLSPTWCFSTYDLLQHFRQEPSMTTQVHDRSRWLFQVLSLATSSSGISIPLYVPITSLPVLPLDNRLPHDPLLLLSIVSGSMPDLAVWLWTAHRILHIRPLGEVCREIM